MAELGQGVGNGHHERPGEPQAGWYPDPRTVQQQRYWDGQRWTEDCRPIPSKVVQGTPTPDHALPWEWGGPQPRTRKNALLIGWITAFLLPPAGLIIGLRLLGTEERRQAVWIATVSAIVLALVLVNAATDS